MRGNSIDREEDAKDESELIIDYDDAVSCPAEQSAGVLPPWKILIVDDEPDVHGVTLFALADFEFNGRPLTFTSAHSAAQAKTILAEPNDFALALIDVVMESDTAGLELVDHIRNSIGNKLLRIILRTGQPGQAPERKTILDYDINLYLAKGELTAQKLFAAVLSSLRAYHQLVALDINRRGLEKIIRSSGALFRRQSLIQFCEGVLIQISGFLETETHGIVLVRSHGREESALSGKSAQSPVVLAAAGPFSDLAGTELGGIADSALREMFHDVLRTRQSRFGDKATILHISGPSGDDLAVFLATGRTINALDAKLLEVFASNIALGFDNIGLIEQIRHLAFFDSLTGLPNRTQFHLEATRRLEQLGRGDNRQQLVIVLLDLDRFQQVNDGLGHVAGDELLQAVAAQLTEVFSDQGTVFRLNSDLFGVFATINGVEDEVCLVQLLKLCFAKPFAVRAMTISITVSGGYTLVNAGETDILSCIRSAGIALKRAKAAGRSQILRFSAAMGEALRSRLSLVNRIPEARAKNEFSLFFQPQLRLADLAPVGAEALMRWRWPDGTFIRPDLFIPATEDSGHIVPLGEWALRQACQTQRRWRSQGLGHLRIAVNVSVRQLREPDFIRSVQRILLAFNAEPTAIELEITESSAMEEDRVLAAVTDLHQIGFKIAIDDFGTGHSSLARLKQIPASMLKIDRSFVTGCDTRPSSRSIAAMIVKMGQELGLTVLAEGVETEGEEATLREIGCDLVQGFRYARPIPGEEAIAWLKSHQGPDKTGR